MEKINALLNVRERCVKETRERLARCGFDQEEIDDAVSSALRVGLIDEERFARAFIRGKAHSGWGRLKIVRQLHQKGIPDEVIQACADDFPSSDMEYEAAMHELSKRPARSSNPYASYMRRLVSKGYSHELSARVTKDFLAQDA